MKKIISIPLLLISIISFGQPFTKEEISKWQQQAAKVTIIRDNWGIPHVYGKEDADAVFGLLYAQCEDDFKRIEMNYIEKLGRMAEIKGESELANDLLIRMIIDSTDAKNDYDGAPLWLKKLLDAQADAVNFYLYKHPEVKPVLLTRFKPWFQLLWTDGSIGAINTSDITADELKNLYLDKDGIGMINKKLPIIFLNGEEENLTGSNGFAFSPSVTESHNAILYINPHVTFYFRPEVHMVSEEELNVYGGVTWGQLFVYQGFNEHCGWMHTSSYTDIADTYIENLSQKDKKWFYEYDHEQKPVIQKKITLHYLKGNKIETKIVNAFYTHHGPIMAKRNGQYLSMKANNRSLNGLIQSWKRTKTKSFAEYKEVMGLLANTSNNTVYADAEGNIAYWHGNFLPIRDTKYDWSKPVDGSTSATEWKGLHTVDQSVHVYNPANGWIQNCNSTPFTCSGSSSPKKGNYPKYMAPDGENFRGINASRVFTKQTDYTLDKVIASGYDTYLSAFELMVPAVVQAFEKNIKSTDSLYSLLSEPINVLKNWDYRCGEKSVATTLAVEWAERLSPAISKIKTMNEYDIDRVEKTKKYLTNNPSAELLQALALTIKDLKNKYGNWQIPWGDINRYQRTSSDIDLKYNDAKNSTPVGFVSSTWGMLPSYVSQYFPGTKKRYGNSGNSFICAVEFGKTIKAKSLLAGGETGNPLSKHFSDQEKMYANGQFKDVLFYKEDVQKNAERTYHPGE